MHRACFSVAVGSTTVPIYEISMSPSYSAKSRKSLVLKVASGSSRTKQASESVRDAPTQERRGDVSVQNDDAHDTAERRDAYKSVRNSAYSSSDSKGSSSASSLTEESGRTP